MSVAYVPEMRRLSGFPQVGGSVNGGRNQGSNRYEPYPAYRPEYQSVPVPGHAEELDEEEHKPQIQHQHSHQQPETGGYQHCPSLQPHGDGSATYITASYMCNPPSRVEAGGNASWPSGQMHSYMTNAATPQPVGYEAHHVSSNHDVAGTGFGAPPLYYNHNGSVTASQYSQTLVSHGFTTQCVDPASINVSQSSHFGIARTRTNPASQAGPSLTFYNQVTASAGREPLSVTDQKRPNSPLSKSQNVVDSDDMEVGRLVNPILDEGHPKWLNAADQTTLSEESPASVEEVETTDSIGAEGSIGTSEDVVDVDGEGDYILDDDKPESPVQNGAVFSIFMGEASAANRRKPSKNTKRPSTVIQRPSMNKKQQNLRGPFIDQDKKAETAATRKRRACTRCRQQKQRCKTDPEDPDGDCIPCKGYSKTSRKTIHRAPCQRGKITDAILVREGGLNLTRRWQGTLMKDVGDRPTPNDIREIEFTIGACPEAIKIQVVEFTPIQGDVTARVWMDKGKKKKLELPTFCLSNIHATAAYFEHYVQRNAVRSFLSCASPGSGLSGSDGVPHGGMYGIIERTYTAAWQFYQDLRNPHIQNPSAQIAEQRAQKEKLLSNLFMLWFTSRHTTGMSYICGEETLGMKPYTKHESYPLYGRISLPRMIVAQFDSITHTRILEKYSKDVLKDLEYFISQKSEDSWWTVYICLFILLREASYITEDRYRHARNNYGDKIRYSLPAFVEELQSSCTLLVQYWHYYNTRPWPDPMRPQERHKSGMPLLTAEQYQLVAEARRDPTIQRQLTYRRVLKENNFTIPDDAHIQFGMPFVPLDWDHPLFWISQIFEDNWKPHNTYQRESMSNVKSQDD